MREARRTQAESRAQAAPDRVGHAQGLHQYPETDDGRHTQSTQMAAWYELGRAYARAADHLVEVAQAFMDGYADQHLHPADRAIRDWQRYLAGLPWWRRWAVKLWYSL